MKKPEKDSSDSGFFLYGANARNRTADLLITSELLYLLSYVGQTLIYPNCALIFVSSVPFGTAPTT